MAEPMEKPQDEYVSRHLQRAMDKYDQTSFADLIKQVQTEYAIAYISQSARLQENLTRLKLYNNQKLDKDLVGEPLMFGILQGTLAALYDDTMTANFEAKEEGDQDTEENLNSLGKYDYKLMKKAQIDYEWIWDACFFGRGFVYMKEFDRRLMCPKPVVWDSMTFLHDPFAISVNGDIEKNGEMKFGGREISMTKQRMKDNGNFINIGEVRTSGKLNSLLENAQRERFNAQGLEDVLGKGFAQEASLYGNADYNMLEWLTNFKGRKVSLVLSNNMKTVNRFEDLGSTKDDWPLIDRPLYPTAHTWNGISIPDLTEDKQRQKSVALNLGIKILKSDLYPAYAYDEKAVKNPADLANINKDFNRFVPLKGKSNAQTAISPINKASPNMQLLQFVLDSLDASAQRATANPDIQQGQLSKQERTLGELNLVASRVDKRFALATRIFGWSEEAFWQRWYGLYKKNFKDKIDEKIIRLNGAFGAKWRPLTRENIVASVDPDVVIESAIISEANNFKQRTLLTQFGNFVNADPTSNKRYFQKKLAKLFGMQRDEIDRLFPPTVEEIRAEKENDIINKNNLPPITAQDDHKTHWEIHSKASETEAKLAHMEAHLQAMSIQRNQPELFPQPEPTQQGQPVDVMKALGGGQPSQVSAMNQA